MVRILVVEDEAIIARDIKYTLENLGYTVPAMAASGADAIRKAADLQPDLVIMDIVLKGPMDGIQAAAEIRAANDVPVIYLTAYGNEETLQRAKVTAPYGYILKPFEERELHITVEIALHRHQMEKKLRESYDSLERTNERLEVALQAKDEMIQNVSHELRTPLTHLCGYLELLIAGYLGPVAPEQLEALEIMERQTTHLHHMIDRLLTLQTFDSGRLHCLQLEPSLWLMLPLRAWQQRLEKEGRVLKIDLAPGLPTILMDPDAVQEVVENLLDNAAKFSASGSQITVRAWAAEDEVVLSISDRGIGIPAERLEHIFERFYQVDGGSARQFAGMGIGLALCRKIVEAHGGRIWAESRGPSQGSTFFVALPQVSVP